MEFRILGPLEVADGDRLLSVRGSRQRALLALLVLHANEVVTSEHLIDELWGERPPESGVTALQVRISQLRKALPAGVLATRPSGYVLDVDAERIDARRFELLLAQGRAALAEQEPWRAAGLLAEALGLWRGPALADLSSQPFARPEIARLEELRLAALEERVEADLALGRHAAVVGELEALAGAHPLRERLRHQQMLALYRSGRQADALDVYREARRVLVEELGLEPGEELRRLEQAILRHDPSLAPARAPDPPPAEAPARPAGQERKVVTVLFVDQVGSTERVSSEDPERVRILFDRYYEAVANEIEEAGGSVEKFVGDAVAAVFGAPVAQEDHAERALHVALAVRRRLAELFGDELVVRIGVATGEVVAGEGRESGPLVTGTAVNESARLEQTAAPGEILAAERTVQAAGGAFEFGLARQVEAKGIPGGIPCRSLVRALTLARPRGVGGLAPVFVGREHELELLRSAYERVVREGRPAVVTLVGDAGVGKSRLVRELWDWLATQTPEPRRRTGRCLSYGKGITYRPLGEILREELGLLATDPPELVRRRLGDREILGLTLGLDVASDIHPQDARRRLHGAWVELVDELVAERPKVILIEDLHWAQDAVLELLDRTVRDVRGPLLVIGTGRPELLDRHPSWGGGHRDTATVWLEPLAPDDTEVLLDEILACEPPEPLRRLLVQRAEGNPFFLEELLASLMDRGVLVRARNCWTAAGLEADFAIPDSVQSVLAARIDLLPPAEKAALQAAAVIGRVFWRGSVSELLGAEACDLTVLETHDFVRRRTTSSLAGEREFAFKHALTREVAYAGLPKARRAHLHAAFAGWLEHVGKGRAEHASLIAYHYAEAARPEDVDLAWAGRDEELRRVQASAVHWLSRAAAHAIESFELDEAIALLERALEVAAAGERCPLWRQLGRAKALRYDADGFWTAMERACDTAPDEGSRAELCAEFAYEVFMRSGMWIRRPGPELVGPWIDFALEHTAPRSRARTQALVAEAFSDLAKGAWAAEEAWAIAEELDDPELRAFASDALQLVTRHEGDHEGSWMWTMRRLEQLDRVGDPDLRADIVLGAVPACMATCRFEQARSLARLHDEIAAPLTPHHRVHGIAVFVEVEELLGDWKAIRALEHRVREAVADNVATPCTRNARSLLVCALAAACVGDTDAASRFEAEADLLGQDARHAPATPRLRLALARGDLATADELVGRLDSEGDWYRHGHSSSLATLTAEIDALVALGRADGVESRAPLLLQPGTYTEPFALRALGVVRGDDELVRRALARFEELGLDWHAAQTRGYLMPARPPAVR